MELKSVRLSIPEGCNIILGQTHFIKTVEDLYEILVGSVPNIRFGIAFNEASGPCLVVKRAMNRNWSMWLSTTSAKLEQATALPSF